MSDSSSKTKKEETPFINNKSLEETRKTPIYINAKDRIELIQDIFSINEENFQTVINKLRQYLTANDNMVEMFFLASVLFIYTRFKSDHKFGFSLLNFFKENYLHKIKNLINVQKYIDVGHKDMLDAIKINDFLTSSPKNFSFYDCIPNTIPSFLFNDDIQGLQNYVSKEPNVDFNKKIKIPWLPYKPLGLFFNFFEYSILFGSLKCFKFLLLQNEAQITKNCNAYALASGNSDIIHILEQKNHNFNTNCFFFMQSCFIKTLYLKVSYQITPLT